MDYQACIDGRPVEDEVISRILQCSLANIGHTLPVGMEINFTWGDDGAPHVRIAWPGGELTEYIFTKFARTKLHLVPGMTLIPDAEEVPNVPEH